MMKKFRTIVAASLAAIAAFGVTACGGKKAATEKEDPTKTYLDVGVFDAGLGTAYFDALKKDFEAYYADKSFETGKQGVVVRALKKSTEFNPANLVQSMKNYEPIMYILDHGDYEEFTKQNLLADVTDVMTDVYLDDNGNIAESKDTATQSIEDTMIAGYSDVFKKNERYYAVPYMLSVPGIIYDADLFDTAKLYFKADGTIGANAADVKAGNCGVGPDGVASTSDDGLPETWDDFLTLMKRIRDANYYPFTWAESPTTYQISRLVNTIWANYEGYDNYMLNYSFNGYDTGLEESIDEENFIDLLDQEGRKAAIKAFYDITKNSGNYSSKARPGGGNNHTGAQREYIQSKRFGKRIAMFVENSYWEQEARDVFNGEPNQSVNGYGKRNFKYMPIPKFIGVKGIKDQTNTERVLPAQFADSYICISAKNKNKNPAVQTEVAKLFIKFMQQRSQLVQYTANTGCIRPYNYTVSDEEAETCTPYTQSILKFIAEGAKLAPNLQIATKRRLYNAEIGFYEGENGFAFRAKVGNSTYMDPFTYFFKNTGKTVDNAVADMKTTITNVLKQAGATN